VESLFRVLDQEQTRIMQIDHFKQYLFQFVSPNTDNEENNDNDKLTEEIEKMGSFLASIMDSSYRGTVD
jgi:hypothetical protein